MRWSQRWPMRLLMEQIFSKADAIELPDYEIRQGAARALPSESGATPAGA
jgi:hypothetical protein